MLKSHENPLNFQPFMAHENTEVHITHENALKFCNQDTANFNGFLMVLKI